MTAYETRVLTVVAETDIEFGTVPDQEAKIRIPRGDSIDFHSVDTLYISAPKEVSDDE